MAPRLVEFTGLGTQDVQHVCAFAFRCGLEPPEIPASGVKLRAV